MKRGFVLLTALAVVLAVTAAAKPRVRHRVVFDAATGEESWDGILNNVENLQKAFAPEPVQLEVVAHGKALGLLLKDARQADRVESLARTGVVFAACENTMRRQNVTAEALNRGMITVPSGVAELVKKQEEGWSYVRAGG